MPRDRRSDALQAFVACRMAIEVVELLETVDVDHDKAERGPLALGAAMFPVQRFVENSRLGKLVSLSMSANSRRRRLAAASSSSIALRSEMSLNAPIIPVGASPLCVPQRAKLRLNPDPSTVAMPNTMDDVLANADAIHQRLKDKGDATRILGMRHADGVGSQQCLRLVAENFARSRRDILVHEVAVELDDHVGAIVGEKPIARLTGLETHLVLQSAARRRA